MKTIFPNRITNYTKSLKNEISYIITKNNVIINTDPSIKNWLINKKENTIAVDQISRNRRVINGTFQEFRHLSKGKK